MHSLTPPSSHSSDVDSVFGALFEFYIVSHVSGILSLKHRGILAAKVSTLFREPIKVAGHKLKERAQLARIRNLDPGSNLARGLTFPIGGQAREGHGQDGAQVLAPLLVLDGTILLRLRERKPLAKILRNPL